MVGTRLDLSESSQKCIFKESVWQMIEAMKTSSPASYRAKSQCQKGQQ